MNRNFSMHNIRDDISDQFSQSIKWTQLGHDIYTVSPFDQSNISVALSGNGNILAIGGVHYDVENNVISNYVHIYKYIGTSWTRFGKDIVDKVDVDGQYGINVSLSNNGTTVAIGSTKTNGNGNSFCHARVYIYNGSNWIQLGQDIEVDASGTQSCTHVKLSNNGQIMAICAYLGNVDESNMGRVCVYQFNGDSWIKLGQTINGTNIHDKSSWKMELSGNGKIIIICEINNEENESTVGSTTIYEFNGTSWVQLGSDIDEDDIGNQSGYTVDISSDGKIVAIGSFFNENNNSGHVRVYGFDGIDWIQIGQDIDGNTIDKHAEFDIALSDDGGILAIVSPYNDGNGLFSEYVRVVAFDNGYWKQIKHDIDGVAFPELYGYSVDISRDGNRVVICANFDDGNGIYSGYVRVYELVDLNRLICADFMSWTLSLFR